MNQEIILALIVSADTFLTAAAYRSSDIKIPAISAFIINFTSAAVLALSLLLSDFIGQFIAPKICSVTGFIILTAIGLTNIYKSIVRTLVKKLSRPDEIAFRAGSSGIIIKLYLDETSADSDNSHTLSVTEAFLLAAAGSLDSASTGISCGFNEINPILSGIFALIAGFAALGLGTVFGKKISSLNHDFSWLGGVLIIAFAVFEFLS